MSEVIYHNEYHVQFIQDMEDNGVEWTHYEGRWSYEGPAARCESIDEIMAITSVPCTWDNMGLRYIVYPLAKGGVEYEGENDER